MSAIALEVLADETGGQLVGESVALQTLAIDSRKVKAGALFVALSGQRVDGHDFAPQALAAGASALLTERELAGLAPQLVVADVLEASGRFGSLKRQAFEGDVIAITGSAGKTTTKNLVAAALATTGEVHATAGNQNNELGVPITLSGLTNNHRFGVIEMGAGQPGDIAYLCQLARPNVAVCLNASAAHLAHYDSVDAIAATKGEIFEGLAGNGLAVINADQKWLPQWREQAGTARQVSFGLAEDADYRATDIQHQGIEGSNFKVLTPAGSEPVSLQLAGEQHIKNALAALAIAIEMGVSLSNAARAIQTVGAGAGRGVVNHLRGGGTVVDDSYNANPAAVNAALEVLSRQPGYRVLVLGPMLELGEESQFHHQEVGRYARQLGIDRLITVGSDAAPAAEAFGCDALCFADQTALQRDFPALPSEHTIWVKGSRGAGLEHTVDWLLTSGGARSMLMWLSEQLLAIDPGFAVFQYLTLRGIFAACTALAISMVVGPCVIERLNQLQIGQTIREEGPQSHLQKAGTPTMGGALILVTVLGSTLLWADLGSRYVWVALITTVAFGAIGWIDDYRKVVRKDTRGLLARWKYLWQSLFAFGITLYLFDTALLPEETTLYVPFFKDVALAMGWLFVPLSYFVVVGSSNAVNLTDGLDGLAIMPTVMVATGLGVIAYLAGHIEFAEYLNIAYLPGTGELMVFCGAIAGAGLGFLWFNTYPAMIFMGDVGALALGAALGIVAVMTRHEIVLFIMGGIFVLETVSVIIQVGSFKLTGKRVFRMAPIHHHFELKRWPEPRVIVRFWIITVMLVLFGLATLKLR